MLKNVSRKQLNALPSLVVSDEAGNLFDLPEYAMLARSGNEFVIPEREAIIPLPYGSDLHVLPDRYALGIDRRSGKIKTLKSYRGMKVFAASAFLAPAYTALYLSACKKKEGARALPLFAYAAVGFDGKDFVAAALRVDNDKRQDCENFDQAEIIRRGKKLLKKYKGNRLTTHLIENCAFDYLCPAARNWVMGRWEAPVPVSVGCNSECRGCISKQPEESDIPSTQDRLNFTPTVDEIVQYCVPHLESAPRAVVSFGQGCEGEPLTQARLIEEAVREMRKKTQKGTINLNSNASMPEAVEKICNAGLDSIRISLNSAQERYYERYFKPKGYGLSHVKESMKVAKALNKWVSLNYFIYPGFTDRADEMAEMTALLKEIPVNMIQMRNLNMDPHMYWEEMEMGEVKAETIGIRKWMEKIKEVRRSIKFGYFNPPLMK
ncbi:MAG: radical SAM protein [Deltaproteobacteria bacterium]|nr:radical SAM protein [Deltaproteobacteria bacterium]